MDGNIILSNNTAQGKHVKAEEHRAQNESLRVCVKINKGISICQTGRENKEQRRDIPDKRLNREVLLFIVNHRTARLLCCVFMA